MTSNKKKLFAGPWVGEFGWELFCWQGIVRHIVQSGQYSEVVVSSRPGHDVLYQDFADEFIPYLPETYLPDAAVNRGVTTGFPMPDNLDEYDYIGPNVKLTQYTQHDSSFRPELPQSFHKYGTPNRVIGYDVIIHARATDKNGSGNRNWEYAKWCGLVDKIIASGKSVASIGTKTSAFHIPNTDDRRDVSLSYLADLMAESGQIVGPSSGPMHFASLCGLSQLVWSPDFNRVRYERDWNPFKTEVIFVSNGGWDPEIEDVFQHIK